MFLDSIDSHRIASHRIDPIRRVARVDNSTWWHLLWSWLGHPFFPLIYNIPRSQDPKIGIQIEEISPSSSSSSNFVVPQKDRRAKFIFMAGREVRHRTIKSSTLSLSLSVSLSVLHRQRRTELSIIFPLSNLFFP